VSSPSYLDKRDEMKVQKKNQMNVQECEKYILTNDVQLSHIKFHLEQLDEDYAMLRSAFEIYVPALKKVEAYKYGSPSVDAVLQSNMTQELMLACKQTIGVKVRVDTLTTVPLLMTMNQMNIAQVEFRGGNDSLFHVASCDPEVDRNGFCDTYEEMVEDNENLDLTELDVPYYQTSEVKEIKAVVISTLPVFRTKDLQVLQDDYGVPNVVSVTPDAANLASICAGAIDLKSKKIGDKVYRDLFYHKFGEYKQIALPKPFEDNILTSPTISKCRQQFLLPGMSKEGMIHEIATHVSKHPDAVSDVPRSTIQQIAYKGGYKGTEFKNMNTAQLEDMWNRVRNMAPRYMTALKNFDTGFASINAPLKWSPVLGYLVGGTPYFKTKNIINTNKEFKRSGTAVFYGAAGGRMDALMRTYFKSIRGRDIVPFSSTSKKISDLELRQLKVPKWEYGDILAYQVKDENYMISDVFMKAWSGKGGNLLMSRFLAGLMRGSIVSGEDERKILNIDNIAIAAKMLMPHKENLGEFEHSYPFVVALTCRPLTSEIILIKNFFQSSEIFEEFHKNMIDALIENFNDVSFRNRFFIVRNKADFEFVIRTRLMSLISETFFQIERITTDWATPLASMRNRKWFLAAPQMPNLFRTMKVSLSTNSTSWSFDPAMSDLLKVDLEGYSMTVDQMRDFMRDKPLEKEIEPRYEHNKEEEVQLVAKKKKKKKVAEPTEVLTGHVSRAVNLNDL